MAKTKIFRKAAATKNSDPPIWNLERDGVTQSMLYTFSQCRYQTDLKYVQGWRATNRSGALEFGTLIHELLDRSYSKGAPIDVKKEIKSYHKMWLAETGNPPDFALQQQQLIYAQAAAILPSYFDVWKADDFKRSTWISLEETFKVPYVYEDGLTTFLCGKFDGVFKRNKSKKKRRLLETKTKARFDEDSIAELLPTDFQVWLYLYALRCMKRKALSVTYNIIRRPQLRQKQSQSLAEFTRRMKLDIRDRPDFYFVRLDMDVMESEIKQWKKRDLDPHMKELRLWVEGVIPTRVNRFALVGPYGRSEFYNAILKRDFQGLHKVNKPFTELEFHE